MTTELLNGPDQILPAESYTSIKTDVPVRLRIPKKGSESETVPPTSIPGLLTKITKEFPKNPALAYKVKDMWCKINYKEYLEQVRICAKAFIKLGLEKHHAVCIMGFNSPEWLIADLAAIFARGIAVGIYTSNSSEACDYCANHSKANIIVVQNQKQLDKIHDIKSPLPHLKSIIVYEEHVEIPGVINWDELMIIGKNQNDQELEYRLKSIGINECCTIIYSSGTTDNPKAVMLSHDNLTFNSLGLADRVGVKIKGHERVVGDLPLSHVAAQIVDIYFAITTAGCTWIADSEALKDTLLNTVQDAKPTFFLGVPRTWEKIQKKLMTVAEQQSSIKKKIYGWAKRQALEYWSCKIEGVDRCDLMYNLASHFVHSNVKKAIGFNCCHYFLTSSAPINPAVKIYFFSIDIPLMEGLGMSELSGAHTFASVKTGFGMETVGKAMKGVKTKIVNARPSKEGEICMYGRHVFMGYLGEREITNEILDSEGWVHSGDLGRLDKDGFLYVNGRLKDIINSPSGENIAPSRIKFLVKNELPHISNVFIVGDERKFLSVLLTLKTETDPNTGVPSDTLLPSVQKWLHELGCPAKTVSEVLKNGAPDPKLQAALTRGINRANHYAISNAQKVQKLSILPADFSFATGELGPTLKVKRNVVLQKYASVIDKMYS